MPLPGGGHTLERWRWLWSVARESPALARLAEGHLDALAILAELDHPAAPGVWGVWAAEPGRLTAAPVPGGWCLVGEKRWCSGSTALDHALVVATAPDGPRLFAVAPTQLQVQPSSWPAVGMQATASETMRFTEVVVPWAAAVGGAGSYTERRGFWLGAMGVAACWYGGALGVADALWSHPVTDPEDEPDRLAARGRVAAAPDALPPPAPPRPRRARPRHRHDRAPTP